MFIGRLLLTFLLSLLLSIDDLVVGVSYGLRKIKIPLKTLGIIVLGSTLSMTASMLLGKLLTSVISDEVSKYLSTILLVGLGCKTLYNAWRESKETGLIRKTTYFKWTGPVNVWETFVLGLALGVDDFAEALGLSVAGFPVILTVILFKLSEVIAIYTGSILGVKELSRFINGKLAFIPGISLILVGIWQLFA